MQTVAIGWFATAGIGILGVIIIILWVLGLIDVFKRPDFDRGKRSAWVLIIVLLPIVGTIAYFLMRPTLPDEREKILNAASQRRTY
jgi:hypothetical protein